MKQVTDPSSRTDEPKVEITDFRVFLQQELVKRCNQNPRYSLRAFARMLEIEPSALSKILSGRRGVSKRKFKKFVEKLNLEPSLAEQMKPVRKRRKVSTPLENSNYQQLTLDAFRVIAEWYHYAILELTHVDGFEPNHKWTARVLGVSVHAVSVAVERLQRLEFLRISTDGKWIDQSGSITTVGNDFTDIAFRKLQKGILEKAITVLEEVPISLRDQTSVTMAIDSSLMSEAKERIKNFRRDLAAFLSGGVRRDQVYHLGVSLYPVTRIEKKMPRASGGSCEQN